VDAICEGMPLLQPGSRADSFVTKGGGALSKAPILCQPTTLLCSNPERGVRDSEVWIEELKRETGTSFKETEGRCRHRENDTGKIIEIFYLLKRVKWAVVRERCESDQLQSDLESVKQATNCSLWP